MGGVHKKQTYTSLQNKSKHDVNQKLKVSICVARFMSYRRSKLACYESPVSKRTTTDNTRKRIHENEMLRGLESILNHGGRRTMCRRSVGVESKGLEEEQSACSSVFNHDGAGMLATRESVSAWTASRFGRKSSVHLSESGKR